MKTGLLVVASVLAAGSAAGGPLCSADCLVELEAPRSQYGRSDTIELALRSQANEDLAVVVELDELVNGTWRPTPMTISSQDHPFKAVRLSPLKAKSQMSLKYPACATVKVIPRGGGGRDVLVRCPQGTPTPPNPFRLHVSVYRGSMVVQELASTPYTLRPE